MTTLTTKRAFPETGDAPDLERWIANELRLTDAEIRTTLDLAPLGVVLVDLQGRVIQANDGFASMIGWRRDDLSGRRVADFTRPEDLIKTCEVMNRVRLSGVAETVEKCYVHRAGRLVYGRTTVSNAGTTDEPRMLAIVSDVTRERVDADRLSFQTLLLNSVEQAVIATDIEGSITYCNRFAERLYGLSADQILGRGLGGIFSISETADLLKSMRRREAWSGELQLRREDESAFTVFVATSLISDAVGSAVGFVCVAHDLTKKKAAERELRDSESRYRELVESAHEGIAIIDRRGVIEFVNAEVGRVTGYASSELVGQMASRFIHSDDLDRLDCPEPLRNRDVRILRKDGDVAWSTLSRSFLADGRRLIMMMDITSRKDAEAALRASEELLARTQSIARLGSWEFDLRTGTRRWSPEVYQILGISPAGGPDFNKLLDLLVDGDRQLLCEINARLAKGETQTFEFRIANADGVRTLLGHGELVRDERGFPARVLGFVQDITDRKRTESDVRRHSLRQDAISKVSASALSVGTLDGTLQTAVELVREVLGADRVDFLECSSCEEFAIASTVTTDDSADASRLECRSLLRNICMTGEGTSHARLLHKDTKKSTWGIAWPAKAPGGTLLGVLVAYSHRADSFSVDDSNFVRTIANVLGQAIDRHRADAELRQVAQQQVDLAEFARHSLGGVTQDLLEHATSLVMKHMRVEFSSLYSVDSSSQSLVFRAGHNVFDPTGTFSGNGLLSAALSLRSGSVLCVEDLVVDSGFRVADWPFGGTLSAVCAGIRGTTTPLGILSGFSRSPIKISHQQERFLQALATTLAEVMEREGARQALAASEERYRAVVEGASEVIYTLTLDGRISSLNRAFGRVTGWSREDWLDRPFIEFVADVDHSRAREAFETVLGGGCIEESEFSVIARDGSLRTLRISASPMIKESRVTGIQGFGRDLTRTKHIEAEREALTRGIELLLESTAEGILSLDPEGRCVMVNRSASALLNAKPEDLIDRRIHSMIHPSCPGCAIDRVLVGASAERVSDDSFRRPDGSTIPVEFAVSPIVDNGVRKGAVLTFSDASSRIQLEAQLEQANRLTSLGRLAATIAHEFNNVLMGISPFVELLRNPATSKERRSTALDHIAASTTRGKRVTEEILRYTRPAPPVVDCIPVAELREAILADLESILTPAHHVSFDLNEPNLAVLADPNQVHQILTNLLVNARDAMPDGGLIWISFSRPSVGEHFDFGVLSLPERFIHIEVRDTGEGMCPQTLRHAFEPLFTTKRNGTGLGLAVTHQIVKQHGGEIFVQSTQGEGSTFHIFLPATSHSCDVQPAAEKEATSPHSGWRVLLVEDDCDVAAGIEMLLQESGAVVSTLTRGSDVLPALLREPPDVVILDIGLPDIDGTKVYEEFAGKFPDLPVVFSTGHGDQRKIEHHLAKANVGMLLKPYSIEALLEMVDAVMLGGCRTAASR